MVKVVVSHVNQNLLTNFRIADESKIRSELSGHRYSAMCNRYGLCDIQARSTETRFVSEMSF